MEAKNTDLMNVTDKVIYVPTCLGKPVKVAYEGEPITREEALKLWIEILRNIKPLINNKENPEQDKLNG